jgi:radical SAM superfamily enzyme YgiQ (UPF0313 family)
MSRLIKDHVPGHLKVAPEHIHDGVLRTMGKCGFDRFVEFLKVFTAQSQKHGKKQYLVPYLISGHPGCTERHMKTLATYLRKNNWKVQQVQAFIPLPGTLAAAFYFSGKDRSGNPLPVARSLVEKRKQFGYFMWYKKTSNPKRGRRKN